MIDICIAAFVNYDLLKLQLNHWDWIEGDYNIFVCDNTPEPWQKTGWLGMNHKAKIEVFRYGLAANKPEEDGLRHGSSLDLLVKKTQSSIIGICDTDFFWLKPTILSDIEDLFNQGVRCVGAELWYDDFWAVNKRYPERAGWLAPCVFGMFIDRDLALSETFVVTPDEGKELKETGWRIRKKIIDEKIPCHVYRTMTCPENTDPKVSYFGTPNLPMGVHLLKGSSERWNKAIDAYHAAIKAAQPHLPWKLP